MSDINMEAAIRLSAEDRASTVIRNLQRDVDALRRSLAALGRIKLPSTGSTTGTPSPASQALDFRAGAQALANAKLTAAVDRQAARQREADAKAQERAQRKMESESLRALRDRDRATAKALRDQLAGQRLLERETRRAAVQAERDHEAALRRQIAGDRWRFQLRNRMDRQELRERDRAERDVARRGRETWSRGRDAVHDTFRPAGIAALAGTAATLAGSRRVLGAERDVDAAEIGTRAYAGLSFDAARELRERWAAPLAESLGSETAKLLTAWTDATKLGVPAAGASAFAELSTKTAEAWAVPFETVTDVLGTLNTVLTSKGEAFSIGRLKSVSNAIQHLAAKQSTTPERLLEFMKQGAGGAQLLGMSLESAAAFGSASTSLGNRPGESGRLLDYTAGRVIEMPRLAKKKGDEGKQARELVKALGYTSARQMDDQRRADPDSFLPDLMERFARIGNQKKQDESIRYFYGREWLGEASRLIKGADTYREAVKLAKESKGLDAIGEVWKLHQLKLGFVFKQFRAGWLNILGEFGKVLSPMARQAGDVFLAWTAKLRNGGLAERFKASVEGFVNGLGFRDVPSLLEGILSKPGEGSAGAIESWRAAARGFGQGLRDAGDAIRAFFGAFTGGGSDPEMIGRWTARIVAFSAAMVIASPAITVLSGLASGILAIGAAATTALAAFKVAGLVGAGGAAAGAAGAAAGAGGLAAILGAAVLPVTLVGISAAVISAIWGREALKGAFLGVPAGDGAEPRTPEGDLGAELGAIAPRRRRGTDAPAKVEKQSYNGAHDSRPTVTRAPYLQEESDRPRTTTAGRIVERFVQPPANENDLGAHNGAFDRRMVQPATFRADNDVLVNMLRRVAVMVSPNALAAVASAGGGGAGMAGIGSGGSGRSSGGSAGAGPTVPDWFGRGNGTQGGGIQGYGANPGAYKPFLDYVAQAEGTAGGKNDGYDVTLANGALLPGGREQDLTKMTLDQIDAMQSGMLRHPGNRWNSSAAGRYQIVQKTLRGLRRKFGLRGDQLFDERLQDQLGAELAHARGANAGALGQEWASLKGGKGQRAAQLLEQVLHGASTAPQDRPAGAEGGQYDGLRIKGRQAVAGGGAHLGTTDLAREAQRDLPGGVKHFAAFNDRYHLGTRSKHASGLAFDTSLNDPSQSAAAAQAMRAKIREAGLAEHEFTVLDEYRNPSARSTGGHLHTQFNSSEAAQRYHEHAERKRQAARMLAGSGKDERFDLHGWMPQAGQIMPGIDPKGFARRSMIGTAPADLISKPTVGNLLSKMPSPPKAMPDQGAPGGQGRGYDDGMTQAARGGGGATFNIVNHISGAGQNPQELAAKVQSHIAEAWNYRSHDLEPELT